MIKKYREFILEDEDSESTDSTGSTDSTSSTGSGVQDTSFKSRFEKFKEFLSKKSAGSSSASSTPSSTTSQNYKNFTPSNDSFSKVVSEVIDRLEGGYYHPDMLKDGRVKDSRYGSSGETMFGIDRKAGGAINTTPEGMEFWKLIDAQNARSNWKWGYKGGDLAPKLKDLVGKMIKRNFDTYSNKYLDPKSKEIVNKDPRLLFNFIYSVWNGPGWFKKFAEDFNKKVRSGVTDPEELVKVTLDSRTKEGLTPGSSANSLVKQGGEKIANLYNDPTFAKNIA
jgi:hypothetical protein